MSHRRCDKCEWWYLGKSMTKVGVCRLMPPKVNEKGYTCWPTTSPGEWCGGYSPKERNEGKQPLVQ